MGGVNWGNFSQPLSTQTASRAAPATGPHYAGGLAGFAEKLLPAIGSTVGAVGGTLLAPGLGTAAGGAGGAVLGQKLEDLLTGQHTSAGGYAGQAAFGTLGGLGKGLGALKGASSALRAGEGVKTAGNVLRFGSKGAAAVAGEGSTNTLSDALLASNANSGQPLNGALARGANTVGKQAMLGPVGALSKGTAAAALRDAGDLRSIGYTNLSKAAQHSPIVTGPDGALTIARQQILKSPDAQLVNTGDFPQVVKSAIHDNMSLDPTKASKLESRILGTQTSTGTAKLRNAGQETSSIFDKHGLYGGKAGIGQVAPNDFANALKEIGGLKADPGSPESKTVSAIYSAMKSRLNDSLANVPVDQGLKDKIINQLQLSGVSNPRLAKVIRGAQSWSDLSQIESKFVTASKAAQEGQVNSLRGGVPGLTQSSKPTLTNMVNQAGGRIAERGISGGANLFERFASKTPGEVNTAGDLAKQTARKVGTTQAVVRAPGILNSVLPQKQGGQADQSIAPDTSIESLPGFEGGSSQDQAGQNGTDASGSPFTSQNIQQAILVDIATTGGKNIEKLNALYNTFGSPKAQQQLSAPLQVRHDNLNSAISSLDGAEQMLVNAGGAKGAAVGQLAKVPLFGQYLNNSGTAYEKTKTDTASQLAKAVTGGSRVNQSVYEGFLHSLPDITDTPAQAAAKLKNLRTQLYTQAQQFGFNDIIPGGQ